MEWHDLLWTRMADASLRVVILAALAAVAAWFLRRSPAARHAVWTVVLAAMLAMPLLRPVVPAARVNVPAAVMPLVMPAAPVPLPVDTAVPARSAPAPKRVSWTFYAALAYLAGLAWFAARLALGFAVARRLVRGAQPLDVGAAESARVRVPVTIGLRQPRILLPPDWRDWPAGKLAVVLAHESAHVRRRDPLWAALAAANRCVFWFHPLAWWLERHLAALAEHAADDAAVAVSENAESYARTVLDVASRMAGQESRLVWHSAAMSGSLIAGRIRRVLDGRAGRPGPNFSRWARAVSLAGAVLLICLAAAVDLRSVAQAQVNRPAPAVSMIVETTEAEAAAMERQLEANPDDLWTGYRLLGYYWKNKLEDRRFQLVLRLIDRHPESEIHAYAGAGLSSLKEPPDLASWEKVRDRWRAQAAKHPNDPRVLWNAARNIGIPEQLDLLKRARALDPERGTGPLAMSYAMVLVYAYNRRAGVTPDRSSGAHMASQIRSGLLASADIALVGAVGTRVVEQATQRAMLSDKSQDWDTPALKQLAHELVAHAQELEPENRAWSDLMEGVRRMPEIITVHPRP